MIHRRRTHPHRRRSRLPRPAPSLGSRGKTLPGHPTRHWTSSNMTDRNAHCRQPVGATDTPEMKADLRPSGAAESNVRKATFKWLEYFRVAHDPTPTRSLRFAHCHCIAIGAGQENAFLSTQIGCTRTMIPDVRSSEKATWLLCEQYTSWTSPRAPFTKPRG